MSGQTIDERKSRNSPHNSTMNRYYLRSMILFLTSFLISGPTHAAEQVTGSWIEQQVSATPGIRKIEDLLPLLPLEFRKNKALFYGSRSKQGATFENPRVVLFGGRTAIAFNGDPKQEGYNNLEVIEYNPNTHRSETTRFTFPESGKGAVKIERSPKSCTECHGEPPTPVVDSYPFWPGMYGSEDGFVGDANSPKMENEKYKSYLKNRETNARYKWLPLDESGSRPGLALNDFFGELNFQRIGWLIQSNSRLRPFRFAILAAFECNEQPGFKISSFLTQEAIVSLQLKDESINFADTLKRTSDGFQDRVERQKSLLGAVGSKITDAKGSTYPSRENVPETAALRLLIEGNGIDMSSWSLELDRTLRRSTYAFNSGTAKLNNFLAFYSGNLYSQEDKKALDEFRSQDNADSGSRTCGFLRQKSIAALQGFSQVGQTCHVENECEPKVVQLDATSQGVSRHITTSEVFSRCVECHDIKNDQARAIPFDDLAALKTFLAEHPEIKSKIRDRVQPKPPSGRGTMPPSGLSQEERTLILDFLNK